MAKQQLVITQAPTNRKRTIAVALVMLVLLAFVINDPVGAAEFAAGVVNLIGGVFDGVITFFGALS